MDDAPLPVRLSELLGVLSAWRIDGKTDVLVTSLATRVAGVTAGCVYFAVPAARRDDLADQAVRSGAVAVVTDARLDVPGTQVLVPSVVRSIGPISACFFGHPDSRMTMIGITGTNGKTTTAHLVDSILRRAGASVAMIGSAVPRSDGRVDATPSLTTPPGIDLHRRLAGFEASGVDATVMEVSSHALAQYRTDGIRFDCTVFTNLSPSHLAYHGDVDGYARAKARLFTPAATRTRVVNVDDDVGRALCDGRITTVRYGRGGEAALRATAVESTAAGTSFRIGGRPMRSQLRGGFNVLNCLAAVGVASVLRIDMETVREAIAAFPGVPGRMQQETESHGIRIVDDSFNANPASVAAGLATVREDRGCTVVAVLGDMAELGAASEQEHRSVGRLAASIGIDRVVALGSHGPDIAAGMRAVNEAADVAIYRTTKEVLDDLHRTLRRGDTVYIKGSRSTGLDAVAAALRTTG